MKTVLSKITSRLAIQSSSKTEAENEAKPMADTLKALLNAKSFPGVWVDSRGNYSARLGVTLPDAEQRYKTLTNHVAKLLAEKWTFTSSKDSQFAFQRKKPKGIFVLKLRIDQEGLFYDVLVFNINAK